VTRKITGRALTRNQLGIAVQSYTGQILDSKRGLGLFGAGDSLIKRWWLMMQQPVAGTISGCHGRRTESGGAIFENAAGEMGGGIGAGLEKAREDRMQRYLPGPTEVDVAGWRTLPRRRRMLGWKTPGIGFPEENWLEDDESFPSFVFDHDMEQARRDVHGWRKPGTKSLPAWFSRK